MLLNAVILGFWGVTCSLQTLDLVSLLELQGRFSGPGDLEGWQRVLSEDELQLLV